VLGLGELAHLAAGVRNSYHGVVPPTKSAFTRLQTFSLEATPSNGPLSSALTLQRFCPNPKCGRALRLTSTTAAAGSLLANAGLGKARGLAPIFICDCGTSLCGACGGESHLGVTCSAVDSYVKQMGKLDEMMANMNWIGQNTRGCPSCHYPIQKSGGCNHMNCQQCRYYFCWECGGPGALCSSYSCKGNNRDWHETTLPDAANGTSANSTENGVAAHAAIMGYRSRLRKATMQLKRNKGEPEVMECLGLLVQLTTAARHLYLRTWVGHEHKMPRHDSKLISARRAVEELVVCVERKLLHNDKVVVSGVANPSLVSGPRRSYRTVKSERKAVHKAELALLSITEGNELDGHLLGKHGKALDEPLSKLQKRTAAVLKDNAYTELDLQIIHGGAAAGAAGAAADDEGGDAEARWGSRNLQSRLFSELNRHRPGDYPGRGTPPEYLNVQMAREPEDLVARREVMDRFMMRGGTHRSGGKRYGGYRSRDDGTHPEKKGAKGTVAYKGKEKRRGKAASYSRTQDLE